MIGKRLKQLRKARGLKLREVADASGISISYLSKMENDSPCNPTLTMMTSLAKVYGVSIRELIFKDADGNPLSVDELRLIDLWRAKDWRALYTFIGIYAFNKWENDNES